MVRTISLAMCLGLVATAAEAYVGPGAGLGVISSLIAVVGVVLLALLGIVLLPARMIMKRRRQQREAATTSASASDAG